MTPQSVLRTAITATLVADATLAGLVDPQRIAYRPRRELTEFPALTFFDFGTRPDATVPLMDRTVQFDAWAETLADADEIRERVRRIFDGTGILLAACAPMLAVRQFYWTLDTDLAEEDGEIVHAISAYRALAYIVQ